MPNITGLSPPTRGNRQNESVDVYRAGSIPAHAGEPKIAVISASPCAVYPRPRGGTCPVAKLALPGGGLSPPTRGNLSPVHVYFSGARSIPAHAGEPDRHSESHGFGEVYPRPRGGTGLWVWLIYRIYGLSPPTRGNLQMPSVFFDCPRSIPAHAGEPPAIAAAQTRFKVYPRPRGGTFSFAPPASTGEGLSPPTRGNQPYVAIRRSIRRSIPAHAGEPVFCSDWRVRQAVYPRPRGGTHVARHADVVVQGLSPPTRGNRSPYSPASTIRGSIPAHAGEPRTGARRAGAREVYPRPRGGTSRSASSRRARAGLSPPTRGNRPRRSSPTTISGSIPAHAGEPADGEAERARREVYPRPRGGTPGGLRHRQSAGGLSPPTRGNRSVCTPALSGQGSIPAHAGEPAVPSESHDHSTVYPRPRGGTSGTPLYMSFSLGLSPPTRGNQREGGNRRC